jgi:chromosome segregation ATPase
MENDEYRRLVEFLTREFGRIDARFVQVDARFASTDAHVASIDAQLVAVRRDMDGLRRDLRDEIHQQGETFAGKLSELRHDIDDRFDEVKALLRSSHVDLDRRVRRLEERG